MEELIQELGEAVNQRSIAQLDAMTVSQVMKTLAEKRTLVSRESDHQRQCLSRERDEKGRGRARDRQVTFGTACAYSGNPTADGIERRSFIVDRAQRVGHP